MIQTTPHFKRLLRRLAHFQIPAWTKLILLMAFVCWLNMTSGLYTSLPNQVAGLVATVLLFIVAGSLGKWTYRIFTFLFLTVAVIHRSVKLFYGEFDYNLFLALRYTNLNESLGYLSDVLHPGTILVALSIFIALNFALYGLRIRLPRWQQVALAASFVLILPPLRLYVYSFIYDMELEGKYATETFAYNTLPGKIVNSVIHFTSITGELAKTAEAYKGDHDWHAYDGLRFDPLNVVVIGESSRADFYGPDGSMAYDLTPNIDTSYNYYFSNCYSLAPTTIPSLERTLFLTDSAQRMIPAASLVALLKKKGVRTYWVSNQGFVGKYDSPITALALTCDSMYFSNQGTFRAAVEPDMVLMPRIRQILDQARSSPRPVTIFIHLMGSHSPLSARFHTLDIPYPGSTRIREYMQSIRETDKLLGMLLNELSSFRRYNLFYFSDHGTGYYPEYDAFIHGDGFVENYHVPLSIWSRPDPLHRSIAQPVTLGSFFTLFNAFNGVRPCNMDSLLQVLPRPNTIFNSNDQPTSLQKLGTNKIDLTADQ